MLVAFRKLAHNFESSSVCCWCITILLVLRTATRKQRYPSLLDTVIMHLGGGGLSSDLGNDLLAIPLGELAMIESLDEYSTYLLKRTRGGGARLRRPSRERTLTIFP
jgi:hypothetical protein